MGKNKFKKKKPENEVCAIPVVDNVESLVDMSSWDNLFVPPPVLKALSDQKFTTPTPIQCLALPAAIRDRMDVLGAAETGSGKTLAFGIPMIHRILADREWDAANEVEDSSDVIDLNTEGLMEVDNASLDDDDNSSDNEETTAHMIDRLAADQDPDDDGEADQPPDEEELLYVWKDGEVTSDIGLLVEELDPTTGVVLSGASQVKPGPSKTPAKSVQKKQKDNKGRLYGLVLTPTRELAVQVGEHLRRAAQHTNIRVCLVFGGMSADKQERILRTKPEIVVATPGRLWEFIQQGEPHLSTATGISVLVIDEADRMVEKGHFAELRSLLDWMSNETLPLAPGVPARRKRRQTLVFSATLTFVHSAPKRIKATGKMKSKVSEEEKLRNLTGLLNLTKARTKMIDVSQRIDQLTEWKLHCRQDDKDLHLFWFLRQHPGRSLVFCNSKSSVRRLASVLTLLECKPLVLHADMHQKHRLKSLEKFTENPDGLLLATDVAARGLDIPSVHQVLHFDVPRTAELYLHRSGRTARARCEGESLLLVDPAEKPLLKRLCHSLHRTEDSLPLLTPSMLELDSLRPTVDLARDLDRSEHRFSAAKSDNDWFQKTAEEMDIELDEDLLAELESDEFGGNRAAKRTRQSQHAQLSNMLAALRRKLGVQHVKTVSTLPSTKPKGNAKNNTNSDVTTLKVTRGGRKIINRSAVIDLLVSPRFPAMRSSVEELNQKVPVVSKKAAKRLKLKERQKRKKV